jgi:hypothetical protein
LGKGLASASSLQQQQQQQQLKGGRKLHNAFSAPCLPALDINTTLSSSSSNLDGNGSSSLQAASSSGSSGGSSPVGCTARVQVLPPRDPAAGGVKLIEHFTPFQNDPSKSDAAAAGAGEQHNSSSSGISISRGNSSSSCIDEDRAAAAGLGPELVGFVLLDPLWEQGQEVGYVASVQRMKGSAHPGEHPTQHSCHLTSGLLVGLQQQQTLGKACHISSMCVAPTTRSFSSRMLVSCHLTPTCSACRCTPCAFNPTTGTLKLLTEDIISKLRQEGRQELTFGFAPLFNMNDGNGWRYLHWLRWTSLYLYHCANNVYAFKNLAYSKIRWVVFYC